MSIFKDPASSERPLARIGLAQAGLSELRLERLAAGIDAAVARGRMPGAVALVARDGAVAWHRAFGQLRPDDTTEMPLDAIFRIYSMTKPIVSVAALMLVEEGRLRLDLPVSSFIPAFGPMRVGHPDASAEGGLRIEPAARPITVHDLLRHTSGITYEFLGTSPVHAAYREAKLGDPRRSNAQMCDVLAGLPLLHSPGERWSYGHSTDVLGRIVEIVSGDTLGHFLRQRIFEPLGMKDTAFHVAPEHHERIAEPFAKDPDSGSAVRLLDPRREPALEMGGGGLMGTAMDYARFLAMLQGHGRLAGVRLLARTTVQWMTSDHLDGLAADGTLLPPGHGFGLGVAVRLKEGIANMPGRPGQYFWGGIAGTTFWVDPVERLFAILMVQAPMQRDELRALFRSLVYASIDD